MLDRGGDDSGPTRIGVAARPAAHGELQRAAAALAGRAYDDVEQIADLLLRRAAGGLDVTWMNARPGMLECPALLLVPF